MANAKALRQVRMSNTGMLKKQEEGQWGKVQRAQGRVLQDEVGRLVESR